MSTTSVISAPNACWACHSALGPFGLLCAVCGKIQPPPIADYFQVFGLERQLNLDVTLLESDFHRLSRRLHPDRFARATVEEQQWSLANTALLNDAYRTLREPIQRTEYLLQVEGLNRGEEHAGKVKGPDRQPPADLLEEVFELNMQLEEMRMNQKLGEDDPSLHTDLADTKLRFEALLSTTEVDLQEQGSIWDKGPAAKRSEALVAMAALLDRRRYLRNLVRDVNEVLSTNAAARPENHA